MLRVVTALSLAAALVVACSEANKQKPGSENQKAQSAQTLPTAQSQPATQNPPAAQEAQQPPAAPATTTPPRAAPKPTPPARTDAPAPQPKAKPAPAPAPAPAEPPAPEPVSITIPAGTPLQVTLLSTLSSNGSAPEDPVHGSLAQPLVVNGQTVVPKGASISGVVVEAKEAGRVKGRATVVFQFNQLVVQGQQYRIQTANVTQQAGAGTKSDVKKGGVGAAVGAVTGGVIGGGKGAAIGTLAGGAGAVLGTKGQEISLQPGTAVTALLQTPLTVTVQMKK